jgi:hypothetical protein
MTKYSTLAEGKEQCCVGKDNCMSADSQLMHSVTFVPASLYPQVRTQRVTGQHNETSTETPLSTCWEGGRLYTVASFGSILPVGGNRRLRTRQHYRHHHSHQTQLSHKGYASLWWTAFLQCHRVGRRDNTRNARKPVCRSRHPFSLRSLRTYITAPGERFSRHLQPFQTPQHSPPSIHTRALSLQQCPR